MPKHKGMTKEQEPAIEFDPSDYPTIQFVNYVEVTHSTDDFVLTFAQLQPRYLASSPADKPSSVRAQTIVRIAVTPAMMRILVDVLSENLEKFLQKQKEDKYVNAPSAQPAYADGDISSGKILNPIDIMKLSVAERDNILQRAALLAEEEYRTNANLTDFNAFGDGDLYDESP